MKIITKEEIIIDGILDFAIAYTWLSRDNRCY